MVTPLRKKYSLQIAISTLFITISVVIGVVLTWQSFNKTSDIILNSAHELYKQEAKELSLDMKATYGSIAGGLRQFRLSPATHATTFEERIAYLPSFQAVLDSEP